MPRKDGDAERPEDDAYKNSYFINEVVDKNVNTISVFERTCISKYLGIDLKIMKSIYKNHKQSYHMNIIEYVNIKRDENLELIQMLKALGDETRLRIINILKEGAL